MQTRSFSKAFRSTIIRMWWIPFLFASIAGPVVYIIHEIDRAAERFVSSGRILLEMSGGMLPEEAVIEEHEFMLESSVRRKKAMEMAAQMRPEASFAEITIDARREEGASILAVTGSGTDGELVRELLRLQFHLYMGAVQSSKDNPTPESAALDLANVNPQVLEWPGPAVESNNTQAILSGLLASLTGAFVGIALMLFVSGVWAFFRPAWIQPSRDEIMRAAEGLDASGRVELLERMVRERGGDANRTLGNALEDPAGSAG